jgi:hypothetical protein
MYRTGDLVRLLENGVIDYIGRTDFQVKLRGQRVELGEIAAAIARYEGVQLVETLLLDGHLVAFAAMGGADVDGDGEPTTASAAAGMRAVCVRRLAAYMVPTRIVVLRRMPVNANGKADRVVLASLGRAALRERHADGSGGGGGDAFVAPRNDVERAVAGVWAAVLGVDAVGVEDRFFELGGNSLSAIQAVHEMRRVAGVHVALADMFVLQTIGAIVAAAASGGGGGVGAADSEASVKDGRQRAQARTRWR